MLSLTPVERTASAKPLPNPSLILWPRDFQARVCLHLYRESRTSQQKHCQPCSPAEPQGTLGKEAGAPCLSDPWEAGRVSLGPNAPLPTLSIQACLWIPLTGSARRLWATGPLGTLWRVAASQGHNSVCPWGHETCHTLPGPSEGLPSWGCHSQAGPCQLLAVSPWLEKAGWGQVGEGRLAQLVPAQAAPSIQRGSPHPVPDCCFHDNGTSWGDTLLLSQKQSPERN